MLKASQWVILIPFQFQYPYTVFLVPFYLPINKPHTHTHQILSFPNMFGLKVSAGSLSAQLAEDAQLISTSISEELV